MGYGRFLRGWAVAALFLGAAGASAGEGAPSTGVAPLPQGWTVEKMTDAYRLAREIGGVAALSQKLGWSHSREVEEYGFGVAQGRRSGLEILISVDLLTDRRGAIGNLPAALEGKTFAHPGLRRAYQDEVLDIVRRYRPRYLMLAIEINGYAKSHPRDFPNFVSLYRETRKALRKIAPGTAVGVTFQYDTMYLEKQWDTLAAFGGDLDVVAFTTYPGLVYGSLEKIPEDYYGPITGRVRDRRPVVFAEVGWRGMGTAEGEREQARFVAWFFGSVAKVRPELVVWSLLHDRSEGSEFTSMGLIDAKGRKKPAWAAFQRAGRKAREQASGPPATGAGNIRLFTSIIHERDLSAARLKYIGSRFDLVLMQFPFKQQVDALRRQNRDIKVLLFNNPYFAFGEKFWKEGVDIARVEPSWLLRTKGGRAITYSGPEYKGTPWGRTPLMDLRSAAWRNYYAEQSKKWVEAAGMDGLFIDTLTEEYPAWALGGGREFAKGYTGKGWKRATDALLDTVKKTLGPNRLIVFNGISNAPGSSMALPSARYIGRTHGAAYEAYSVYLNMDRDEATKKFYFDHAIMTAMRRLVREGKIFVLQVSGGDRSRETRLYALASFLLLQNEKTYFYYAPDESRICWYPEWEAPLGEPLGDFRVKEGVYQRDFSQGRVVVNPSGQRRVLELGAGFRTLDGEAIGRLTLAPWAGRLLLKVPAPR